MHTPNRTRRRGLLVTSSAALLALGVAAPAAASHASDHDWSLEDGFDVVDSDANTFEADIEAINGSDAHGSTTVEVDGDTVTVEVVTDGLSADLPHAQHLHIGGDGVCPDVSADTDGDGVISTAEGQPSYGEIRVSLTTTGDARADSGLAIDRMPVADEQGTVTYERTLELPDGVEASQLRDAVIVQHGIADLSGDPATYDGQDASSVDPSLPLEATVPAACGELEEDHGLLDLGLIDLDGLLDLGDERGEESGDVEQSVSVHNDADDREQSIDGHAESDDGGTSVEGSARTHEDDETASGGFELDIPSLF